MTFIKKKHQPWKHELSKSRYSFEPWTISVGIRWNTTDVLLISQWCSWELVHMNTSLRRQNYLQMVVIWTRKCRDTEMLCMEWIPFSMWKLVAYFSSQVFVKRYICFFIKQRFCREIHAFVSSRICLIPSIWTTLVYERNDMINS
jgi:hypothetical protein